MTIEKAFVKEKEVPDEAVFNTQSSVPRNGKSGDSAPKCDSVIAWHSLGVIQKPY